MRLKTLWLRKVLGMTFCLGSYRMVELQDSYWTDDRQETQFRLPSLRMAVWRGHPARPLTENLEQPWPSESEQLLPKIKSHSTNVGPCSKRFEHCREILGGFLQSKAIMCDFPPTINCWLACCYCKYYGRKFELKERQSRTHYDEYSHLDYRIPHIPLLPWDFCNVCDSPIFLESTFIV